MLSKKIVISGINTVEEALLYSQPGSWPARVVLYLAMASKMLGYRLATKMAFEI